MQGELTVITAEVPLAETFGYSTDLRSQTQGQGTFTMELAVLSSACLPRSKKRSSPSGRKANWSGRSRTCPSVQPAAMFSPRQCSARGNVQPPLVIRSDLQDARRLPAGVSRSQLHQMPAACRREFHARSYIRCPPLAGGSFTLAATVT